VHRNSEVSPWFALLVLWYPVWETLYSAYRRKRFRGRSPASADGLHLHTLVYRRVVSAPGPRRSALTSVCLAPALLATVIPAALFWHETWVLQAFAAAFALLYLWIYWRIVRFRVPGALVSRGSAAGAARDRTGHSGGTL